MRAVVAQRDASVIDDSSPATHRATKALPSAAPGCTMSDYKADGDKVSWKMACKGMAGTGDITFTGDTYEGLMNVTSPHVMAMKMSGKRVGDCAQ